MEKLVLSYSSDNGVESWNHTCPFLYPSQEGARYDLLDIIEKFVITRNKEDYSFKSEIIFAGLELDLCHFVYWNSNKGKNKLESVIPDILSLEEWFETNRPK